MNTITVIGNLCRDFEERATASGVTVAKSSIAVKRDRKESDGTYATDFFDVTLFGAQATFALNYVKKGDKIALSGSVHIKDYTAKDNTQRRSVEITATSIENLTSKQQREQQATVTTPEEDNQFLEDIGEDEAPW